MSGNSRPGDQAGGDRTRIVVAITSHNRRATTLRCLHDLFMQQDAGHSLEVVLLDDASTDGTVGAIAEDFPQVTVLRGNGSRFWSGGMADAMSVAIQRDYDFLLLLNDDVELAPDAIARLLDAHAAACDLVTGPSVIAGAFTDPETGLVAYSGFRRPNRWFPAKLARVAPDDRRLVSCDTINGNCVLVPREVVRRIGVIDRRFVHQLGDLDYGFRAVQAGGRLWVAPGTVGRCAVGPRSRNWTEPGLSFRRRWSLINQPKGWPLRPWLHYMWRHGGAVGIMSLAASYAKALLGRGASARH